METDRMGINWAELGQREADRLAVEQEHELAQTVRNRGTGRPGRGALVRRSVAWVAVWVVTAVVLWQAMP